MFPTDHNLFKQLALERENANLDLLFDKYKGMLNDINERRDYLEKFKRLNKEFLEDDDNTRAQSNVCYQIRYVEGGIQKLEDRITGLLEEIDYLFNLIKVLTKSGF